jgi:hypothetical protein
VRWGQITNVTAKSAGTTHVLEGECGGVRSRMLLQKQEGQRTNWRWSGSVIGSDHRCDAKGAGTTHGLEVERERDGVRSWMRLQMKQGRRTFWRCKEARWNQITDATLKGAA